MQTFSVAFQVMLDKGQVEPRVLVDTYELYDPDYIPGVNGFDPADAVELFAPADFAWNGNAYRREVISRGDIAKSITEKTNSCTITFSNISRYMATLAENQTIEGMLLVIRAITPLVTDDSCVEFVGRCDKPGDIDKKVFPLSARQDFGNINQTLPPRKFTAVDPEGRLPSDPLFEGINFVAVFGTNTFPVVGPASGFFARLIGQRDTTYQKQQWSSMDGTPYGQVIREVFGRVQIQLRPFAWADKGLFVTYLMEACAGPIKAIEDIKTRTEGFVDPAGNNVPYNLPGPIGPVVHLGDPGGTGTNLGNTNQMDLGGGSKFSHLAYIEGASDGSAPDATDNPPVVTALVFGRIVPLPNGAGAYVLTGWTDNPVHIARFILTDPSFVNINPGFMEDSINYLTAQHCDTPLIDETNDQLIVIHEDDIDGAGTDFNRYRSTGLISARTQRYEMLGDTSVNPNAVDGPYTEWDPLSPIPPELANGTFIRQKLLRKRYTANFPITEEVRAIDLVRKTLYPTFKGFDRVNKRGKVEIRSEQPSDATRIRATTAVAATSIPVLNVTPWKSGPDLLAGRILLGTGLLTSEVRTVTSADYSTSGNSISLTASAEGGGVTATASGATLTGGSLTVQASGTVTFGGTPAAGNIITITIDGIAVSYTLDVDDTTSTVALMLRDWINATPRLQPYILASWASGTPTVVTIKCLHGALNVIQEFLKAHAGPVADPSVAPTIAAAASGALAAGIYYVAYADYANGGQTALTPVANVTLAVNEKINVSALPAFPAGVTERRFYISEETGSQNLRWHTTRADAVNFSINSLPLPGAVLPPSSNSTAEELIRVAMSFATNSQDVFPAWPRSTVVVLNDIYLPTVLNGHKYKATSITTGITAATEPTWPTTAGGTVVDGGVTWTEIGSTVLQQAGLTRSNIIKDSFKFPLGSRQSSVNQIKGNFRSAKDDFALTPFIVNDKAHYLQVKKWYPMDADFSAVDNEHQMKRLAGGLLSKFREGDWFETHGTGPQGLVLEEGDPICVSDDAGGLINVAVRIEELRIRPNHEVVITQARKYSTNMFSDDVGSHQIIIPSTLKLSRPRAVTDVTAALDATNDLLVKCVAHPRPIEEPAEVVCEFWASEDRDDPADLKLTLPMVTGTTQAALMASSFEGVIQSSVSSHASKNNLFSKSILGIGCVGTTIQAITTTFQRFDVELTSWLDDAFSVPLANGPFLSNFGVALHVRANAEGPYSVPLAADCPLSVEWTIPTDYYNTYPEGTIRETYRTYGTILLIKEGIDPGKNPCQIVANEVADRTTEQRPGPRYSFLLNGNEIAVYRDYNPAGGNKHIVKISSFAPFPLRLTAWLPSTGFYIRNVNFSGAIGYSTILARRDQVAAFGFAQSSFYFDIYQKKSRYNTADGFPVSAVFPDPLTVGLVSYWKLDEISGTRNDSWGSNHLTDNNTVTSAAGVVNTAAQFTAPNLEYLSIADNPSLSVSDIDFTICARVKLDSKGGFRSLVNKGLGNAADTEHILDYSSASDRFRFLVANNPTLTIVSANSLGSPSVGTWYFIVVWHDSAANTINIQVNNGAVDWATHSVGVQDLTNPFLIGALTAGLSHMDGAIDEVGFWKRVLTAEELTEIYENPDWFHEL